MILERKEVGEEGAVLLKGQTYLCYCGNIELPPNHHACLSPKSSIGRVDMMVRAIVDRCGLVCVGVVWRGIPLTGGSSVV